MIELYEYLDSIEINTGEQAYNKIIKEWTKKDRERFASYLFTLIKVGPPVEKSIFNFTANRTLAGFPTPCASERCRMGNIEKMARFASLYADTIFIPSPFDKYLDDKDIDPFELLFDIYTLLILRPLIENHIIKFSSEYLCVCESCLSDIANEENKFNEKMKLVYDVIEEEYLNNNKYYINFEREKPYVQIEGPEKYGFHGSMTFRFKRDIPEPIKEILVKGRSIEIPHNILKEIGVIESMTSPIIDDLYSQNSLVNLYDVSYLTHRDVDIEVMNALHSQSDIERSNQLVEGLSHLLPVINDLSLDKIVELRIKEGEAFSVYRDSLNSVVKDKTNYSTKELKELFRDKINPELNKIEQTIKRNKKQLTGSIVKDVIFTSSIVSIGLYSGILPKDIGKVVAAIGGTKFLYELYNKIGKRFSTDEEINKNSYYFLWKLQN